MTDFFDPDNDDGRGYEPENNNKKSSGKWWWSDYDYDYRDYSYSKGSGSRSWMKKIGCDSDDWWRPKKNAGEVYQDLLDQLQNSANLIGSNERGKVAVHWSNGSNVNDLKTDKDGCHNIYLSPDNLLSSTGKGSEVSEEVLDAMTGKVYLASTLRETVDEKAYEQAKAARSVVAAKKNKVRVNSRCPCGSDLPFGSCCKPKVDASAPVEVVSNAVTLWEAIETSIARSKIIEDWAGFGPYIAGDAERSSANKQTVQDFIDASVANPTVDAAATAIAWNLLNSSDPVTIPDCYEPCIDAASEMMEEEIAAEDRFSTCEELTDRIYKILETKKTDGSTDGEPDSESKGGGGDGSPSDSSKDDGEDEKDDGGEGEEGSGGKPSVCDSSLLGDTVGNSTDTSLSEQEAADEASMSEEEKAMIAANAPDDMCDLGKKFDVIPVKVRSDHVASYREIVQKHRSEINMIRSSLMFRNTAAKMVSYGHRSGEIDENSLFKICMNDDRVMTKTDVTSTKNIAICLLVDESGSMGAGTGKGSRYEQARNVAIVMAESLRGMDGISVSIYGHSAEEDCGKRSGVVIREYYSPRQANLAACAEISARCQNHDSWAIMHTANMFNRDYLDYDRKIMFVISDGEPAGSNYGGSSARKHMLDVNKACLNKGVEVYGIGVDNAFSQAAGKSMYGDNRFVILNDVSGSLGIMSRFVRQIAMK